MRKTIAIIMLLSVTAVFGQRKQRTEDPAWKLVKGDTIRNFTVWENGVKKHYTGDVKNGLYVRVYDTSKTKKPATKKPVTKPTTRKTKIENAGDVYIGEFKAGDLLTRNTLELEYDFTSPVQYHGYTVVSLFPAKTKCDTVKILDTVRITDTAYVPVYLVDVTDTVPATVLYKKSEKSDRIYTVKGFALVRGFKTMVQGKPQWADKPQIVGAIDDKKRLIKNVIQVL